ncbi:MAG: hypothetical protein M1816_000434 [Peltula sp. TS41687]|nr:MAG: hypothetical protein M1816_000434 [Peltula sp. TS41687]
MATHLSVVLVVFFLNLLRACSAGALSSTPTLVQRATPTDPEIIPGQTYHLEGQAIWRTSAGGLFGGIRMSLESSPGRFNNQQKDCYVSGTVIANATSCVCTVTNYALRNTLDCRAVLNIDRDLVPKNRPAPTGLVVRWEKNFLLHTRGARMRVRQPIKQTDCSGTRRECDGLSFVTWPQKKDIAECPNGELSKPINIGDEWLPRQDAHLWWVPPLSE